tara:strand:+ start:82 stop:282 length:201 start_codon:yes stop_codon:yes gene_type:complete
MKGEIKADVVHETIKNLRRIEVNGETMQYIIENVGMEYQMLRQLVLSNSVKHTVTLLNEHTEFTDA